MAKKAGRPYQNDRLTRFLEKRILELRPRKTQAQIATQAGFVQVNMISMLKSGRTKLPLDRVPALATALECDPAWLFILALEQSAGDTIDVTVRKIFRTPVTANEAAWLEEIRNASDNSDPALTTKARTTLRGIFGK